MSSRVYVCRGAEIPEGRSFAAEIDGKPIAVYRIENQLYAIDDVCPHMGASLSAGPVENLIVTCPWHYWRFRLTDGAWADNPRIRIGCHGVVEEEGCIYIDTAPKE